MISQKGITLITERDTAVFLFINRYGKSYIEVLGATFFPTVQKARSRINKLYKEGYIKYITTGLITPRRLVTLSENAKHYLREDCATEPKSARLALRTIEHNMIEQLADYHLSTIQDVNIERTTVMEHSRTLKHVPDLLAKRGKFSMYVEVELTKKSSIRYKELIATLQDAELNIVLYVSTTERRLKSLARTLPTWDKLRFITIDKMISNIKSTSRVSGFTQEEALALS